METTDMQAIREALTQSRWHVSGEVSFNANERAWLEKKVTYALAILDKIDKPGEGEVRGTGKVLTDEEIERIAWMPGLGIAMSGQPYVSEVSNRMADHAEECLRYARDNGYLSAPAKAPAGVVEAGNRMRNTLRSIQQNQTSITSSRWEEIESLIDEWNAALKSTNTPEHGN